MSPPGFEPGTQGLKVPRSATELRARRRRYPRWTHAAGTVRLPPPRRPTGPPPPYNLAMTVLFTLERATVRPDKLVSVLDLLRLQRREVITLRDQLARAAHEEGAGAGGWQPVGSLRA